MDNGSNGGEHGEPMNFRSQTAIAQAAQAASQINAKLGISQAGVITQVPGLQNMGSTSENLTVPDRLVGLG